MAGIGGAEEHVWVTGCTRSRPSPPLPPPPPPLQDGVYPEKVNAGRVGDNTNMRRIGQNVNPATVRSARGGRSGAGRGEQCRAWSQQAAALVGAASARKSVGNGVCSCWSAVACPQAAKPSAVARPRNPPALLPARRSSSRASCRPSSEQLAAAAAAAAALGNPGADARGGPDLGRRPGLRMRARGAMASHHEKINQPPLVLCP